MITQGGSVSASECACAAGQRDSKASLVLTHQEEEATKQGTLMSLKSAEVASFAAGSRLAGRESG